MKLKRILTVLLAAVCLAAPAAPVFAEDATGTTSSQTAPQRGERENPVETLVESGVISQTTADAMQTYMEANRPEKPERPEGTEKGERPSFMAQFVTDGVISQETADTLETYMQAQREASKPDTQSGEKPERGERGERPGIDWSAMIEAGVISQTDAEALETAMTAKQVEMDANRPEKPARKDMFAEMLSAGVITQAEYDAIVAALSGETAATSSETETTDAAEAETETLDSAEAETTDTTTTADDENAAQTTEPVESEATEDNQSSSSASQADTVQGETEQTASSEAGAVA